MSTSRIGRPKRRSAPMSREAGGAEAIASRYEAPDASPGFLLWQVATLWQRGVRESLAPVELTHAQFVLLVSTAWLHGAAAAVDGEPITQTRIAAHAKTDAVMTSEVLRTLEKRGLVRRLPHPADARAKRIEVTAQGRRLAQRAVALVEAADEKFFDEAPPEVRALERLLRERLAR